MLRVCLWCFYSMRNVVPHRQRVGALLHYNLPTEFKYRQGNIEWRAAECHEKHVIVEPRCELLYLQPQNLSEGERDAVGCGVGCDVRWGAGVRKGVGGYVFITQ